MHLIEYYTLAESKLKVKCDTPANLKPLANCPIKADIIKELKKMIPPTKSEFSSAVLFVENSGEEYGVCVHYRLNEFAVSNR